MATKIPHKYIPTTLSKKDTRKQRAAILRARTQYKRGKYVERPNLASFRSRKSGHIERARQIYDVDKIVPSRRLAKKSGCSIAAMNQIVKKGEGAYYSSGSRPNQTAQSWAYARLASALTGGKSAIVDYHILEKGCAHNGTAYRLARKTMKRK